MAVLVTAALLAACGAPVAGPPVTITAVPYDLTRPAGPASATPDPGGTARPYVYLVRDQVLVPVRVPGPRPTDPSGAVAEVLGQLTEGPSERDRLAGLSTALGPGTTITLTDLSRGVARVDLSAGDQAPAASRVPLAVAQVVLTVTSVPGVDAVLVTRDGDPVELPLPGGALTASPVTAADYVALLSSAKGPTTAARATPST